MTIHLLTVQFYVTAISFTVGAKSPFFTMALIIDSYLMSVVTPALVMNPLLD
jgi:hypothetical protein